MDSGALGGTRFAHYVASKAAVIGLTRAMAMELRERQIAVNSVAPGFTDTPMTRSATSRETNISPDASVVYLASYYLGAPGFGPEELSSLHKMMIGNLRIRED